MEPQKIKFERNGWMPNNPNFPVLLYRAVLDGTADMAEGFELHFAGNGWGMLWRNGVYPFHHYHSNAHEVLGFARGTLRLMLGGPGGAEIEVSAGDVAILPAGTGHCRLSTSPDLLVVGGYPPGEDRDLCHEAATPEQLRIIRTLPAPATDPVTGRSGGLTEIWR